MDYAGNWIAVEAGSSGAAEVRAGPKDAAAALPTGATFVAVIGGDDDGGSGGSAGGPPTPVAPTVLPNWSASGGRGIGVDVGADMSAGEVRSVAVALPHPDYRGLGTVTADSVPVPERQLAGQVNVIALAEQRRAVTVVPVDVAGAAALSLPQSADELEGYLNRVYRPAMTQWDVAYAAPVVLAADDFDGTLDGTGVSGNGRIYNAEELGVIRAVRRALRSRNEAMSDDRLYVLVVGGYEGGRRGFMPRGQQIGFIDLEKASAAGDGGRAFGRVVAHELGHGAFGLQHLDREFGIASGTTDNLMDGGGSGERLYAYQWREVQAPGYTYARFDEGGGGGECIGRGTGYS